MKKTVKIVIAAVCLVLVLWASMLITDVTKSNSFDEPVFAQMKYVQPDDGSILYQGIGYTVLIRNNADENGEVFPEYSEVKLFGILISAVIV